ncbi:MAG: MGMT family protein [Acidimicrobiales bacterium]
MSGCGPGHWKGGAEPPSNGNVAPGGKLLAALPPGSWTTYGDVAEVLGTHPVPVGQQVATVPMANAHRVLTAEGRVSSGFRWTDPDRIDDPVELMKVEGVRFLPGEEAQLLLRSG